MEECEDLRLVVWKKQIFTELTITHVWLGSPTGSFWKVTWLPPLVQLGPLVLLLAMTLAPLPVLLLPEVLPPLKEQFVKIVVPRYVPPGGWFPLPSVVPPSGHGAVAVRGPQVDGVVGGGVAQRVVVAVAAAASERKNRNVQFHNGLWRPFCTINLLLFISTKGQTYKAGILVRLFLSQFLKWLF